MRMAVRVGVGVGGEARRFVARANDPSNAPPRTFFSNTSPWRRL